jgi:hypothetical protein
MEKARKNGAAEIHTGLTLREIDQINQNLGYVKEVLILYCHVGSEDWGESGPPEMGFITTEACDRLKEASQILNKSDR